MKTWNQLFIRHGWNLEEKKEATFNCKNETLQNLDFLFESLDKAKVSYSYGNDTLDIHSIVLSEKEWIDAVSFECRGRGESLWSKPGVEEPKVRELDVYISGIVRQLNRLGFYTMGSCDGHGRRAARVLVLREVNIGLLSEMLVTLGMKRVYYRTTTSHFNINLPLSQEELLDLAEKMSHVKNEWLDKGSEYIQQQLFNIQLEELLSIPGESGNEHLIREAVKEKITPLVDYISVDRHGNLLAEKRYNSGTGPVILLNAHLDTVEEIKENRTIIKENGIWSSSEGILGADDRAGVAVILHIAEQLHHSTFSGTVKYIFTVKEEQGLVGARNVDSYFLWGTDAAIVVDRRGTGDIVTSCGGYLPFCDQTFGDFIEKIASESGMNQWKCTSGGSSDTRIWAEHGIQSVNLSAGYGNEHMDSEYLDVDACYQTTKLIKEIFNHRNELRNLTRRIKTRERIASDSLRRAK